MIGHAYCSRFLSRYVTVSICLSVVHQLLMMRLYQNVASETFLWLGKLQCCSHFD